MVEISSQLTREEILRLFKKLDEKLGQQNFKAKVFVVGGVAMMFNIENFRMTEDIDANFQENEVPREIINEIANEEEISSHWLNNSINQILSYFKKDNSPKVIYGGEHLEISIGSNEYILALKCAAGRNKDVFDIEILIKELNLKNRQEIINSVRKYFMADLSEESYQLQKLEDFLDLCFTQTQNNRFKYSA